VGRSRSAGVDFRTLILVGFLSKMRICEECNGEGCSTCGGGGEDIHDVDWFPGI